MSEKVDKKLKAKSSQLTPNASSSSPPISTTGTEILIVTVPCNPSEDIKALEANLKKAQQNFASVGNEIGYQLQVVKVIKPYWENMSSPPSEPAVVSGSAVLQTWREQSEKLAKKIDEAARGIVNTSGTGAYLASTTITLNEIYPVSPPLDISPIQQVTMQRTEQDFIEKELRKIDDPLADTYATVWQYMHYLAFDPVRGPLFLMRQVFDHFLDKLAPDSEVESQPNFQPDAELKKKNGKGITRPHRIEYIAKTRVQDPYVRQSILNSSRNFLDVYRSLNEAHKRGTLNENSARQAVYTGNTLLANWLRAISEPSL